MTLEWKKNRKILLGVRGGISAYKAPEIAREFEKKGWDVEVALSHSAERFVSPLAISTLTGRKVWLEDDFISNEEGWKIPHITLAGWADVIVVAPATATFLHKAASGDAGCLLSASLLASRSPVILFPAMNSFMWDHPAVRENIRRCKELGYIVAEPGEGHLACGYEGKGRLPSIEVIREETLRAVVPLRDLAGIRVLVTSGPTREALDPVRFISNRSSGKMGSSLARTAWYRGADVTMISGPASEPAPYGVRVIPVESAGEMFDAVMDEAASFDIVIKAAAVSDYSPARKMEGKIKREEGKNLIIEMTPNKDIAAALGASKKSGQFLVGFAAETDDPVANAERKLVKKGLDLIVLNDIGLENPVFGADENSVRVIGRNGVEAECSGSKEVVADAIWDSVCRNRKASGG